MTTTMHKAEVQAIVASTGTRICTVSFLKKDGTMRVVNGLFKTTSNMVGSALGEKQGLAMAARGQVPIFELSSRLWKSFYADMTVSIK